MGRMLRRRRKEAEVELGTIRVPSGELVLLDGGYMGGWSGTERPSAEGLPFDDEALLATIERAVDLRVVGPDAERAARVFDRQSLTFLYDLPEEDIATFRADIETICAEHGLDARVEVEPERVPHRTRARRCAAAGGSEFIMFGIPVVAIGGIPSDRDLRVTGRERDFGGRAGLRWTDIRIHLRDEPPAGERELGVVGVDWARILLGDADALGQWQHDRPVDGLADIVFWGSAAELARRVVGGGELDDDNFGWENLELPDAVQRLEALEQWKEDHPSAGLQIDVRPHSHHWAVLEEARRSPHGAGGLELAGARLLLLFTSWGDGLFPVFVETSAAGLPVAVRIQLGDEARRQLLEDVLAGG